MFMTKETWISLLEGSEGLISYPVKSVRPLLLAQVKKQEFGVYIDKLHNPFSLQEDSNPQFFDNVWED